jgi:hypothetical protein
MGLVLGGLYEQVGILAAVVAHASFDAVFIYSIRSLMSASAGAEAARQPTGASARSVKG